MRINAGCRQIEIDTGEAWKVSTDWGFLSDAASRHDGTKQKINTMVMMTHKASTQKMPRQPSTGIAACTGSVAHSMPSEPVISIQELALSCVSGLNQRR